MFREKISQTIFAKFDVIPNLTGGTYSTDVSFYSTLAALLYNRLGDDCFQCKNFSDSNSPSDILDWLSLQGHENSLYIINRYDGNEEDFISSFNAGIENNEQWRKLDIVTEFFKSKFNVGCFINPSRKLTVLFVFDLNYKKWHYLQAAIPSYLPWYFKNKDGEGIDLSETEFALLRSLQCENSEDYITCLQVIADKLDIRERYLKTVFKNFETSVIKNEYVRLSDDLRRLQDTLTCRYNDIAVLKRSIRDAEIKMVGYETRAESDISQNLADYFIHNKNLYFMSISGDFLYFAVTVPFAYFDEDILISILRSETSYIYHPDGNDYSGVISNDEIKSFLKAIFIDRSLKLWTCAGYMINAQSNEARGIENTAFNRNNIKDCIPNAHIDHYGCLGDYQATICDCLIRSDFIGAIEQCVASCMSLNFADSTVIRSFMVDLYKSKDTYKCVELPDGSRVTVAEAIKFLNESGENSNAENN